MKTKTPEPEELRSILPEPEELRSVVDTLQLQQEVSVAGYSKNRLHIDSDPSIHILLNWELVGGLIQLDRVIKIQADGKPIHL